MSDPSKVPVTIVTGFLGAGKTTLISHLIRISGGRRLEVVVNEIGTLGVDGELLDPFVGTAPGARVYGPQTGHYGIGKGDAADTYKPEEKREAGKAWLATSSHVLDKGNATADSAGIATRAAAADGFVHVQDLPATDLLLAADYDGHEAGFAAAQAVAGGKAALYNLDATDPHARAPGRWARRSRASSERAPRIRGGSRA